MEIPAPKIVVVSDPKKDKEIAKLKKQNRELKRKLELAEFARDNKSRWAVI
jgi:hypothetical protein